MVPASHFCWRWAIRKTTHDTLQVAKTLLDSSGNPPGPKNGPGSAAAALPGIVLPMLSPPLQGHRMQQRIEKKQLFDKFMTTAPGGFFTLSAATSRRHFCYEDIDENRGVSSLGGIGVWSRRGP